MSYPAVFIGLVSHVGTRFTESLEPEGLAFQLAASIPASELEICTRDLFDESGRTADSRMAQGSLSAELRAEFQWAKYLGRLHESKWWATYAGRWAHRLRLFIDRPSDSYTRRLLNIEYAHRFLMRRGLDSGAQWVIILEDDASCSNVDDLIPGLTHLMVAADRECLINISDSFTFASLGIKHLLAVCRTIRWKGTHPRAVLEAGRPVTNTVCAMAYSRYLLQEIVTCFDGMPEEPVVPIDWKLNQALMTLTARGDDIQCLLLDPAPVQQLSMR